MRTACLTMFTVLALASHAFGRLGETRQQCETRYGPHVSEDKEESGVMMSRTYSKAGYQIVVIYRLTGTPGDFIACGLAYSKPAELGNTPLNKDEIDRFLEVNADGKTWKHKESSDASSAIGSDGEDFEDLVVETWARMDGGAIAKYNKLARIFSIMTKELLMDLDRMQKNTLKDF